MNDLILQLNDLYSDKELFNKLLILPEYNHNVKSKKERLLSLLDVYKIFIPTKSTVEVYNQLYLSLLSSLEKKETLDEVKLINDNFRSMKGYKRYGVIGGLESFKITGTAGLGKTSTVQRCIDLISEDKIIITKNGREIIPILFVECVADGSFKGLLFSILQAIDNKLGTNHFTMNKKPTITIDILLNVVSNLLIKHVAVLIIDEMERVANDSRKGETLINYLTQLVNQSNISICFVGNESSNKFFESKEYLGRRTIGYSIKKFDYDEEYYKFLNVLFNYQYIDNKIELNGEVARELFRFSNGIPSMIIGLFVEVQKKMILSDIKKFSIDLFEEVYKRCFSNMMNFIDDKKVMINQNVENESTSHFNSCPIKMPNLFQKMRCGSNMEPNDLIKELSKYIKVEFVEL